MTHAARLAPLLVVVALGCTETRRFDAYDTVECIPVQWDASVGGDGGAPDLPCRTTVECPPPLSCSIDSGGREADDTIGTCRLQTRTIDPNAAIELYAVSEFTVAVEQLAGRDYTTLEFGGLPADSVYVRCAWHNCPVDADVLREAPERCLFDESIVQVTTASSLTLASTDSQFSQPERTVSPMRGCLFPSCTDAGCPTRELGIPTVNFFTYCLAYSERALVGASSVITLTPDEIGSLGQTTYVEECRPSMLPYRGVACRFLDDDALVLGVCDGRICRQSCWNGQNCRTDQGEQCTLYRAGGESADEDGDGQPDETLPWIGYCAPSSTACRPADEDCQGGDGGVSRDGGLGPLGDGGLGPLGDGGLGPNGDGGLGPRPDGGLGPRPDGGLGPRPDGGLGPRPDGGRPGAEDDA
ncbi:MAG: hypothetical protein R3F65_33895 [bacterium]